MPPKYRQFAHLFCAKPAPMEGRYEIATDAPAERAAVRELVALLDKGLTYHRRCGLAAVVETDDPHIVPEVLQERFRNLPVFSGLKAGTKYQLVATNTGTAPRALTARDVTPVDGAPPGQFPLGAELAILYPQRYLRVVITACDVSDRPARHGGERIACATSAFPSDPDAYPTLVTNPRKWVLRFRTSGLERPTAVLLAVVREIAAKFRKIPARWSIASERGQDLYAVEMPEEAPPGAALFLAALAVDETPRLRTCREPRADRGPCVLVRAQSAAECLKVVEVAHRTALEHLDAVAQQLSAAK